MLSDLVAKTMIARLTLLPINLFKTYLKTSKLMKDASLITLPWEF